MVGIFLQDLSGLEWLANAETEQAAVAQIEAGDFSEHEYEVIMVLPVLYLKQFGMDAVK